MLRWEWAPSVLVQGEEYGSVAIRSAWREESPSVLVQGEYHGSVVIRSAWREESPSVLRRGPVWERADLVVVEPEVRVREELVGVELVVPWRASISERFGYTRW